MSRLGRWNLPGAKCLGKNYRLEDMLLRRCCECIRSNEPIPEAIYAELSSLIHDAMRKLKPMQRAAFTLFYVEHMRFAEIAMILECWIGAATVKPFIAKSLLKHYLSLEGISGRKLLAEVLFFCKTERYLGLSKGVLLGPTTGKCPLIC